MADVCVEQKMKEIKREARRKRILENAEKRLKLITGDHSEPVYIKPVNDIIQDEVKSADIIYQPYEPTVNTITAQETQEPSVTSCVNTQVVKSTTMFDNFNSIIVIVAILTRLFLSNSFLRYLIIESILMPFILLEIISIVFNSDRIKNNTSFLTMTVYLLNLPSHYLHYITFCIKLFENVSRDLALYFFTFLIFHVFIDHLFV